MAKPLVSDELWARIEPELPVVKRRSRYPGRKRLPDRRVYAQVGIAGSLRRIAHRRHRGPRPAQ